MNTDVIKIDKLNMNNVSKTYIFPIGIFIDMILKLNNEYYIKFHNTYYKISEELIKSNMHSNYMCSVAITELNDRQSIENDCGFYDICQYKEVYIDDVLVEEVKEDAFDVMSEEELEELRYLLSGEYNTPIEFRNYNLQEEYEEMLKHQPKHIPTLVKLEEYNSLSENQIRQIVGKRLTTGNWHYKPLSDEVLASLTFDELVDYSRAMGGITTHEREVSMFDEKRKAEQDKFIICSSNKSTEAFDYEEYNNKIKEVNVLVNLLEMTFEDEFKEELNNI